MKWSNDLRWVRFFSSFKGLFGIDEGNSLWGFSYIRKDYLGVFSFLPGFRWSRFVRWPTVGSVLDLGASFTVGRRSGWSPRKSGGENGAEEGWWEITPRVDHVQSESAFYDISLRCETTGLKCRNCFGAWTCLSWTQGLLGKALGLVTS